MIIENGFGSHLAILQEIFKLKKINSVLEFGCGDYSTDFFINNCEKVTSIEMQTQEWFNKVSDKYKNKSNWKGILCIGRFEFQKLKYEKVDLCFVDGHGDSRPEQINIIQPYTNIIVAHDTETWTYHWERIMFFKPMHAFKHTKLQPHTTIWSIDESLIKEISKNLS
jgi:hypothetical protein